MDPIDQIKQKLEIVSFITPYVALKQLGRNFKGLCPFHGEKTPSFMVSPERQIWHCFGCNKGGDAIAFYQQIENLEFYDALKALAERTGVVLHYQEPEVSKTKNQLQTINELTAKFYNYLLTKHRIGTQALAYVKDERKLLDKTITTFQLGFAPDDWHSLHKFLLKHKINEAQAYKAGVLSRNQKGYFDYFRNRIIFPLHDHRGTVVGFAGRVLTPEAKSAKYINTPETPLYVKGNTLYGLYQNAETIREQHAVMLVEGELDVLSAFQAQVKNAVAIKGTALTENQISLLRRYATTVLLALDSDKAGQAATRRSIELAQNAGFTMRIVSVPFGKDIDDVAKASPQALKRAIENAPVYYEWLIENILSHYDLKDPIEKSKAVTELLPFLQAIDNEIVREYYFKQLAKRLDISFETLRKTQYRLNRKRFEQSERGRSRKMVESDVVPRDVMLVDYLLSLILQAPNPVPYLPEVIASVKTEGITPSAQRSLYAALAASFQKSPSTWQQTKFLASLPAELGRVADIALMKEIAPEILKEEDDLGKEITQTARELQKLTLKQQLVSLRQKLTTSTNSTQLKTLNDEFSRLKQELATLAS